LFRLLEEQAFVTMASTLDLLKRLTDHEVPFVLVGGMAATVHGSSVVTEDLDICVSFDVASLERLLRALEGLNPRNRMSPQKPPLSTNPADYVGWRNLYVVTDAGQLDLLGEITGVGPFSAVALGAIEIDLDGLRCKVMGLADLIRSKRALGRPKDLRVVAELEVVLARSRLGSPR
jgi:predicted nucleotidyltransferase